MEPKTVEPPDLLERFWEKEKTFEALRENQKGCGCLLVFFLKICKKVEHADGCLIDLVGLMWVSNDDLLVIVPFAKLMSLGSFLLPPYMMGIWDADRLPPTVSQRMSNSTHL